MPLTPLPPLLALLVGTIVGTLVQLVAARLTYNGIWHEVPFSKKVAWSSTGGIAAWAIGLLILDQTPPPPDFSPPPIYRLWFYQTIAAWGGAVVLDGALWLGRRIWGEGGEKK